MLWDKIWEIANPWFAQVVQRNFRDSKEAQLATFAKDTIALIAQTEKNYSLRMMIPTTVGAWSRREYAILAPSASKIMIVSKCHWRNSSNKAREASCPNLNTIKEKLALSPKFLVLVRSLMRHPRLSLMWSLVERIRGQLLHRCFPIQE